MPASLFTLPLKEKYIEYSSFPIREVFDVSAGAKYYGPGGGYHGFAGRDATKAFLNLCFTEECKPDDLVSYLFLF